MNLPFQVPMQHCSLQHQTLLLSPVTPTAVCCFCFGSIPSFFLELFLHWSPVAYWAPTDLGSSSFSVLSFCLFILLMGFSRQEYWFHYHLCPHLTWDLRLKCSWGLCSFLILICLFRSLKTQVLLCVSKNCKKICCKFVFYSIPVCFLYKHTHIHTHIF